MIYKTEMLTMEAAVHNFRIFKVVKMLYKLGAISSMMDHIDVMENSKSVGVRIDYNRCIVQGASVETIQF